jgi:hypothetical protein
MGVSWFWPGPGRAPALTVNNHSRSWEIIVKKIIELVGPVAKSINTLGYFDRIQELS